MDSRRAFALIGLILFAAVIGGVGAQSLSYDPNNNVVTSGQIPLQAPDGMQVNVIGNTRQTMTANYPTSGTVAVATEDGSIDFFSAGDANGTIAASEISGEWTNITAITADPNTITITPPDKPQFVVGNEIDSISVRESFGLDDGTVDFVYAGTTGQSRVTIQSVPANQQIVAVDASTGAYLDVATSSGGGAVTFDALDNSEHSVLLQSADFGNPTLSDPEPTGDLDSEPSDISIAVNDIDFNNGDTVDVTIDLDGNQIHTESISANQTVDVSIPASGQTGGAHDWTVEADPDYGNPTSQSYEYRVPSNLTIRNETNYSDVIDSPITSDVTFFGDDVIVTRSTSDGTVNLTGLPVNQDFIAEVQPSNDNLTTRAVYFESIYQQQNIYLLNTSQYETVDARFQLNDPTGQFDTSTILFIQRPINVSGTTTWQTVHSDEFGAEGVTATLQEGQRYRLRVKSSSGTEQIIGPYRADLSETVTVQPGSPSIDIGEYNDGFAANAVISNRTLEYRYDDPTNETDQLIVWIHEKGDTSNRLQANESYFDLGEMSAQATLTENESKKTWVVNFVVDRDGEEFTKVVEVSNTKDIFPALPEPWGTMAGVGMLLLLAAAFSTLNAGVGAVAVAVSGGLLYFAGFLGGVTSAASIVLGLVVAGIIHVKSSQGP